MQYEYRIATPEDLEFLWNRSIAENPDEPAYLRWKSEFIGYNQKQQGITFAVIVDGEPVGEGTLMISPECKPVRNHPELADGKTVGNINALRIRKEYEGRGHVSAMMHLMERHAASRGITRLTIGVEECEARNRAIYQHMGYTIPLFTGVEDGTTVLYYAKDL